MDDFAWIKKLCDKSEGYVKITCPYLEDGKCSIYEKRFACCRNFPQKDGYCSKNAKCAIIKNKTRKNTKQSSLVCSECENSCCNGIIVPKNAKITKSFILRWMNISCADCQKLFK